MALIQKWLKGINRSLDSANSSNLIPTTATVPCSGPRQRSPWPRARDSMAEEEEGSDLIEKSSWGPSRKQASKGWVLIQWCRQFHNSAVKLMIGKFLGEGDRIQTVIPVTIHKFYHSNGWYDIFVTISNSSQYLINTVVKCQDRTEQQLWPAAVWTDPK